MAGRDILQLYKQAIRCVQTIDDPTRVRQTLAYLRTAFREQPEPVVFTSTGRGEQDFTTYYDLGPERAMALGQPERPLLMSLEVRNSSSALNKMTAPLPPPPGASSKPEGKKVEPPSIFQKPIEMMNTVDQKPDTKPAESKPAQWDVLASNNRFSIPPFAGPEKPPAPTPTPTPTVQASTPTNVPPPPQQTPQQPTPTPSPSPPTNNPTPKPATVSTPTAWQTLQSLFKKNPPPKPVSQGSPTPPKPAAPPPVKQGLNDGPVTISFSLNNNRPPPTKSNETWLATFLRKWNGPK